MEILEIDRKILDLVDRHGGFTAGRLKAELRVAEKTKESKRVENRIAKLVQDAKLTTDAKASASGGRIASCSCDTWRR